MVPFEVEFDEARLKAARHAARAALGVRSAHLTEAVAAALGHRTHAALRADLKASATGALRGSLRPEALARRLEELGWSPDGRALALACVALEARLRPARDDDRADRVAAGALFEARVALAWWDRPWLRAASCLAAEPSRAVAVFATDGARLLYNPDHVMGLTAHEVQAALAMAALHRLLGHAVRRPEGAGVLWDISCEQAVATALEDALRADRSLGLLIGIPPHVWRGGAVIGSSRRPRAESLFALNRARAADGRTYPESVWIDLLPPSPDTPLPAFLRAEEALAIPDAGWSVGALDTGLDMDAVLTGNAVGVPEGLSAPAAAAFGVAAVGRLAAEAAAGRADGLAARIDALVGFAADAFPPEAAVATVRAAVRSKLPTDTARPGWGRFHDRYGAAIMVA